MRAPVSDAQTWVKWDFPAPIGPVSTSLDRGHFRQLSIIFTATVLDGAIIKSSRSSAVRAGRLNPNWIAII